MAYIVAEFFQIIGLDVVPPESMAELIPYLLTVMIGIFLVSGVFRVIAAIVSELLSLRKI